MASLADKVEQLPDAAEERDLRKLRQQIEQWKLRYKGLRHDQMRAENELAEAKTELQLFTATRGVFDERPLKRAKHTKDAHATGLIVACDWHAEERVDPATINHENEFNLDIAEHRINQLWQRSLKLIDNARHLTRMDELVLALLGDHIGGHIHEELAESNFLSPLKATLWVQDRIYPGIRLLKKEGGFKRIRVICCSGNHGRDTKKTRIATRESHSYEWLAYQNIAARLSDDPSIQFQIAEGALSYVNIEGRLVRFTHGDSIKFGGGVGGLSVPATKKISKWDQTRTAYRTYFGHFHQYVHTSNFTCCPTLKGYDAFSEWIGAAKEEPAQLFAVFDSKRGLTREEQIFVN